LQEREVFYNFIKKSEALIHNLIFFSNCHQNTDTDNAR